MRSPRRRRDAAATREAILEAATRRFAAHGFEVRRVREIAGDAGVTAVLVNRYFGSKEKLFAEAIERALDMGHLLEWRAGKPGRTTSPGLWCTGTRNSGERGHHAALAPAAFRRDARRASSCSGGTSTATCYRSSPSRSAATTPRPGPSWSWQSHGVRDHAPDAPPQGVRRRSWRRAGGPPRQDPRLLCRLKTSRVWHPFPMPTTDGFDPRVQARDCSCSAMPAGA